MAEQPQQQRTIHAVEAARNIRPMVKEMARRGHEASAAGKPVAYCFIIGLYDELLRAMDITPVWTENYAAICAAKRDAERFLLAAEGDGYASNLCTYAMCGLGFDTLRYHLGDMPEKSPDGGMAKPTMMLGSGMLICDPRYKWYQACQRYLDVPVHVHGLLWPAADANIKEVEGYYIKYVVDELKGLVEFMEKVTGTKMDWERLAEVIDLADRTRRIWWEAYQLRKAVPAPMPTEDAMSTMVPGYFYMGTQEALDFYQGLHDEIKYRVDSSIGVIPDEKYRVLWAAGLPPWFALMILNYFESLGAVFPIENAYPPPDPVEVPKGLHPLEHLATRFFKEMTFRHEKAQKNTGLPEAEFVIELIDNYKIDGLMMHRAFSCRTIHIGQMHLLNVVKNYRDLPSVILESDIVDVRTFSEAETKMRVDAFVEAMETSKKKKAAAA